MRPDLSLPSPRGRGAGGKGDNVYHGRSKLPEDVLRFARGLRTAQTDAETRLWLVLRDRRLVGHKFRRQHPIPPYIVDFYCDEARVVVELDGSQHVDSAYDVERTAALEAKGWTVIRFWNSEVDENADGVAEAILLKAAECLGGTHPQPLPSREGRKRRPRLR